MSVNLSALAGAGQQFFDNNGVILSGGKLYSYAAGTTTPQAAYTSASGSTPHTNPIILNSAGRVATGEIWLTAGENYKFSLFTSTDVLIATWDNITGINGTGITSNAVNVEYDPAGTGAVTTNVQAKLRESVSVKDFGAVGDGVTDDTAAIQAAIDALPVRGKLFFPAATAYKITDTIEIFDKAGCVFDFNNQQINASAFATPKVGIHFKEIAEALVTNIFLIGDTTNVTKGVFFDAAAGEVTIHAKVSKVHVSGCVTGIEIGTATHQVSDSDFDDLYGSDSGTGIKVTGENTLAMRFGKVAAFNNTVAGLHLEEGGGTIDALEVAASGSDIYFGRTDGTRQEYLNRWDIKGGYSEEGVSGEIFINSAKCTDALPFLQQVVISGFRVTPFTTTEIADFIRWKLNGDLILDNVSINGGQQEFYVSVDHNLTYRAPSVIVNEGIVSAGPTSAIQWVPFYYLTDNRQSVEIDARCDNLITFWQNNGGTDAGLMKRGVYTAKRNEFAAALRAISNLQGAWDLSDLPSGTCKNTVLGAPTLALSAARQTGDFHLDDGLIGFGRTRGATAKTISSSSSTFAAAASYTFGCILRSFTGADVVDATNIGGALGIRIGCGTGFAQLRVGGVTVTAVPAEATDPFLVIGRYSSGSAIDVDAINLRTGEITTANNAAAIPAFGALTWVNGISLANTSCMRGFPFVYNKVLSDAEVLSLQQAACALTDSWLLSA